MTGTGVRAAATAVLAGFCITSASAALGQEPADTIRRGSALDREMQNARIEARRTLPIFWQHFEARHGGEYKGDFTVEVALKSPSGFEEQIWVGALDPHGKKISGELGNEPDHLPGKHLFSPVTFTEDQIVDWQFIEKGKRYGYFAARVMAKGNPKREADVKANFWPSPLPPEPRAKH
jgi:uncharacterized protein YegJ (DUF2314 family)